MAVMEEGMYPGTTVAASIYEAASGAVMCSMVVDVNGSHLKGGICLVQKDGTLSERGFKDVQEIFGWRDWDWERWGQEPETFAGAAVQVKVETVQGDRGAYSSIKYVNPAGGGQRLEAANAKGLAAKYGAKTRALFGGTPAAPGRPTPPKPPVVKPPPPPPQPQTVTSTMEECWDVFCKKNEGKPELELYGLWSDRVMAETGKSQNDCGAQDWGKLMGSMTADDIPY
jgi:hypothetical protein